MGGVSMEGGDENPVAINVTAMVDVIFCLCVFYMCSFKFKQVEGRFDSWLPKGKGVGGTGSSDEPIQEIRVALFWDEVENKTVRKFQTRVITTDDELQQLMKDQHDDNIRLGRTDVPAIVDADAKVPWGEVITVVNLAKRDGIENIEFALGLPPTK
jgi:biopolymer transport protein ExbD